MINTKSSGNGGGGKDQAEPLDMDTFYKIADKITVNSENVVKGKINLNTADKAVLIALLEGDEETADAIITYRDGLEEGMANVGDLKNVQSMNKNTAKKIIDHVTTRSSVFAIRSVATARATGYKRQIDTVVARDKSPAEILYYHTGAHN